MSYYSSLTGLNAASTDLKVASNNISNVGTYSFKRSRAEFSDILASTKEQKPTFTAGQGVNLHTVSQQFTQGNISSSLNALDLAVSGNGFFSVKSNINNELLHTRDGAFKLNNQNYVVNSNGEFLQARLNSTGELNNIKIPTMTSGQYKASTNIKVEFNLPSNAPVINSGLNINDETTYNIKENIKIIDDKGVSRNGTIYYQKVNNSDQSNKNATWKSIFTIDGKIIQPNPREYLKNETPTVQQSSDYIEWAGNNLPNSNIRFLESKTPDISPNSLSVVNDVVYSGNGSKAKSIGSIDSTFNGLNGNSLRINLEKIPTSVTVSKTITVPVTSTVTVPVTSVIKVPVISTEIVAVTSTIKVPVTKTVTVPVEFSNGDFEQYKSAETPIGWTVFNSLTHLNGNTLIGGFPTPIDATIPGNSPGDEVRAVQENFTSNSNSTYSTSGSSSYQLGSNGSWIDMPYGILRGPYLVSEEAVKLNAGDAVSFDWKAQGSSDAYDVYGYLLNIDNGETIKIIDDTGAASTETTSWENISQTIPSDGTYKFIFVAGSYDATGGMAVGASLLIDNVKISTSNTETKEITIIEDQEVITYEEREVTTYEDREVITYEKKEVTTYKDEIIESTSIENIIPSEYFIFARNLYPQYTQLQTDTDGIIEFDRQGNINTDLNSITYKSPYGTNTSLTINSGKSTQYSNPYSQFSLEQDGIPEGILADLSIKNNGVIEAFYSNGYKDTIGKIMLAEFANVAGLQQLGDTRYKSTGASGTANYGEAGINGLGGIKSAAREQSNVDLTTELVGLIMAQRNFQSNAKALETNFALQKNMIDNIR